MLLPWYNVEITGNNPYDDTILSIALKRFIATSCGILVAVVFNQLIWPFAAHVELRLSLGVTIHFMGLLYSKLMSLLLTQSTITESEKESVRDMFDEATKAITRHSEMIHLASLEPRIKGPFPKKIYTLLNNSCRNMLDHYQSFLFANEVGFGSPVLKELIHPTNNLRKDMYAAVLVC